MDKVMLTGDTHHEETPTRQCDGECQGGTAGVGGGGKPKTALGHPRRGADVYPET